MGHTCSFKARMLEYLNVLKTLGHLMAKVFLILQHKWTEFG